MIPHNLNRRLEVCTFLLSKSRRFDWLDPLVTGDVKWGLCVNHTRKRQWVDGDVQPEPDVKGDLHPKKVMLSVWWDIFGVIHFELLQPNATITAQYYCAQLQRLRQKLAQKRAHHETIYFLHDNARSHAAKLTFLALLELGWEILPHPPYSPDLAPTDYHIFRSLQNYLAEKSFDSLEQVEVDLHQFFEAKLPSFYRDGIHLLPTRWQRVVENDGEYIVD